MLADGASIRAGGRDLRVVARPGHSTTDALLVDERERIAFVGDHLLAKISSNTEVYPALEPNGTRPRARVEYLESLRQTAAMPLTRLHTGHGDDITAHAELVRRRLADHDRRCERIVEALARRAAPTPSRSPAACGPRRRSPNSRCSSSGRCSGTSTCCSTPDASRST